MTSQTPPHFDLDDLNARTAPEACETMIEVRDGVDRMDRALVALIAERSRYMQAAARSNPAGMSSVMKTGSRMWSPRC